MDRKKVEFTLDELKNAEYFCWKAYVLYQAARDDADILHETGKDLLKSLMNALNVEDNSEARLERIARSGEAWKTHRLAEYEAILKAGILKVKYDSAVRYWDTIVSGLAYKRAELTKLGNVGP